MREIKFRAWDKNNKQMAKVNLLDWHSFSRVGLNGGDIMQFDDVELMQFTDLKDKSGQEIFEGDIVKYTDGDEVVYGDIVVYGTIKYGQIPDNNRFDGGHQGFYIIWQDVDSNKWSEWWRCDLYFWKKKVEVTGNIYENPELL